MFIRTKSRKNSSGKIKKYVRTNTSPRDRIYIDIISIKGASYGGKKCWCLMVDVSVPRYSKA